MISLRTTANSMRQNGIIVSFSGNLIVIDSDAQSKDLLSELELLEFQIHKAEMAHYAREKDKAYHMNLYEKIGTRFRMQFVL